MKLRIDLALFEAVLNTSAPDFLLDLQTQTFDYIPKKVLIRFVAKDKNPYAVTSLYSRGSLEYLIVTAIFIYPRQLITKVYKSILSSVSKSGEI